MPINSRQKGAAAERELANILKEKGFDARRGQQFHGGGDSPDVVGLPGFHVEAKRVQSFALYPALDQATRDAKPGSTPIVVHRRNGREWVVVIRLEDFLSLVVEARNPWLLCPAGPADGAG